MAADLVIRQGDTLPAFAETILDQTGDAFNLAGCSVNFVMRSMTSSTPQVNAAAVIVNAPAGQVQYSWSSPDTAVAGIYACIFRVTTGSGATYTFPNDGYLEVSIEENLTTAGGQTLVSLGEARDYLNFSGADKSRDAKLLRFIRSIQPCVESICGPIIVQQFEEWYDGGQTYIMLRRRPSVTYGTTPILKVQAISEYLGPIEWPLQLIESPDQGQLYSAQLELRPGRIVRRTTGGAVQAFPGMPQAVHVWYTAGQSAVPANVAEGTLELIRLHFQETQQVGRGRSAAVSPDTEEPGREVLGFFVPNKVREHMAPNRRFPSLA